MQQLRIKQRRVKYFLWVDLYRAICSQLDETDHWTSVIPLWKHVVEYTEHTNQFAVHSVSLAYHRLISNTEHKDYEVLSGPFISLLNYLGSFEDNIIVYYTVPL
jgi:hypothetical protein